MKDTYLNEYKNKTVMVTGGAGAIGSNLVLGLLNAGAGKVIVLDDLSSGVRWNVPDATGVVFLQGNILNEEILKRVFSERLDFVFHLAAHFANQNSVDNPETDLEINGLGTLRLLEYSRLARVPKFVFASSGCSVYGAQAPLPLKEDFVSINLDTPYQITKLVGELYCNFFFDYYKLPVVRARFFNSYGPGEVPGRYRNVIPNFTYWARNKKALPITGTGEETRDFTYVGDIVDGLLRLGGVPEAIGDAFNLASERETRVIDLANSINQLCDNPAGVEYIPRRDWDKITRRRASVAKARKIIGYNPKTTMDQGLEQVFSWFSQNWDKIQSSARF
ncbi:MAG: NAD-dependent epimerase/dehydratase family protein [Chloroflexi bacterium]|nr:NAD-dependent epimerase/dehydratase family protein [Chloroflexota bacterium]